MAPLSLGHTEIEGTVRYPGIEVDDVLQGASLRRDQAAAVVSEAQFSNNWLPVGRPVDFV
ncbi:hypothetical protein JEY40_35290 [Bradyrhizobium japonicum]|uniref:hypothetical protein n=1 Tax=Bradyrhizobium japonicum TaxID=375 RepID=UPI00200CC2BD|nr:hypothetical protein [Bradyrhizobium japonicum]UQD71069.1 hypothetical protein JEY40_35290 [Bradyrhizobium japonicum]